MSEQSEPKRTRRPNGASSIYLKLPRGPGHLETGT